MEISSQPRILISDKSPKGVCLKEIVAFKEKGLSDQGNVRGEFVVYKYIPKVYDRMKRKGILLRPGMTLAIEPMINMGTPEVLWMDDEWTVVTEDHSLSAHYENTVLITEGEPEILSLRREDQGEAQ